MTRRLGIRSIPIEGAPVNGTDEQHLLTLTGVPTGGDFRLSFQGFNTVAIAHNATAATVLAALVAINSIGVGGCTVTGNAGGPWTVTFIGNLGKFAFETLIELSTNDLTGGTNPTLVITEATPGITATQRGSSTGTTLLDIINGNFYQNTGTETAPVWDKANSPLSDAGIPSDNVLRVAADVIEGETVTIGADVYEVELVDTDSTDNTQGGDFNNTTTPLTVVDAVTNYPNSTFAVGSLHGIETEIMVVTAIDGNDVTFQRGVSGTTNAAHADAENVLEGDGIDSGSTIAVGLVATLTPTAFTPALADDINNRGTELVKATNPQVSAVYICTADAPGGNVASSVGEIATTETLDGVNNVWSSATMEAGRLAATREASIFDHTVTATEVALGEHRLAFPFDIGSFITQAYDSDGVPKDKLTDQIVIENGNELVWDGTGATNPAAGDKLHGIVWGV